MPLSPRQKQVYDYIRAYIERRDVSPTYDEIRRRFRFASLNSVQKHLRRIQEKGYLETPGKNQKRALTLIAHGRPSRAVPLLGIVAAGEPIEAIEDRETVDVPERMLRGRDNFALRVRGDSMIGEGICDGDVVLVKRQATAENGQTVVAVLDGKATVKKFYRRGERIELRPANEKMRPILVNAGNAIEIRGVVIGLVRDYGRKGKK